jgi:hypothetical protein
MEKTWKPTTAGILSIIAGVLNLIVGIALAATDVMLLGPIIGLPVLGPLAAVLIVLGIVSLVGGIFAIQRRIWGVALAGAICALFPPPVIILGILAIVFVALGKREFS